MGSNNDWLASLVALGDHHLLRKEDLTRGDLNTEVTTRNHDTVGLGQDLVEVGNTLLVLNLDDDLDVGTLRAKNVTDVTDILGATNEGGEDHVDTVLDTEPEVSLVLLGEGGEVNISLGKVDTLVRGEGTVVQGPDVNVGAVDRGDEESEDTVIDVDVLAGGGDLGKVGLEDKNTRSEIRKKR